MKALVGAFNQEKALVGAFSVIVKTNCETDGSFYSTSEYGEKAAVSSDTRVLLHPPPSPEQDSFTLVIVRKYLFSQENINIVQI